MEKFTHTLQAVWKLQIVRLKDSQSPDDGSKPEKKPTPNRDSHGTSLRGSISQLSVNDSYQAQRDARQPLISNEQFIDRLINPCPYQIVPLITEYQINPVASQRRSHMQLSQYRRTPSPQPQPSLGTGARRTQSVPPLDAILPIGYARRRS